MRKICVYSDADNTLWDTDGVFVRAQLQLLEAAEKLAGSTGPQEGRLSFVRRLDQAIAAKHHSGLRYPPILLLRSLTEALAGAIDKESVRRALVSSVLPTQAESSVIDTYRHAITAVPPLLAGVREGLELARAEGLPVYVITEGPLAVARDRIVQLGLSALTAGVLSATKTVPLYLRLADKASPMVAAMVGDQPDKDVRLAHEAGLLTVLVPGRFQPSWTQAKDAELADAVCVDYAGAISWLLSARPGGCLHEGR